MRATSRDVRCRKTCNVALVNVHQLNARLTLRTSLLNSSRQRTVARMHRARTEARHEPRPLRRLAIIGVGPSAIYLLQHLEREIDRFRPALTDIYLFEERDRLGVGMPYDRCTTDQYNLCNISSAEIPPLHEPLVDWLHSLSDEELATQGIARENIDADETYRRTTLGDYFHNQYTAIAKSLIERNIALHEYANAEVVDLIDDEHTGTFEVRLGDEQRVTVDRVVISTGHTFAEADEPEHGYFASPWPMQKLLPAAGVLHNFEIGILGASLSAFDVVSSLSHRHGAFVRRDSLVFEPFAGAESFRIVLHSAEGWLPHLQYEQTEAFRVVYRHVDRDTMLALRDAEGFLSLDSYFDTVCRPALVTAFEKDGRPDIVTLLTTDSATLEVFVKAMSDEHTADDPFALMRAEMREAKRSLRKGLPVHWKETLDDLMFTLNYHFDWLAAEDHLRYRRIIAPFLLNVIAAMPLHSASIMLALHDAGHLDLLPGKVTIKAKRQGETQIEVDNNGETSSRSYRMFVNCSGQGSLDIDTFPFEGLKLSGAVSTATAPFRDDAAREEVASAHSELLTQPGPAASLRAGGIAIDGYYRLLDNRGKPNLRILDIAFPHATGTRPYSFGLQACDATAAVVVQSWCLECDEGGTPSAGDQDVTETYEDMPDPAERA